MSDIIDDYLDTLRRELGTLPDAADVVAELEDHLRATVEALRLPDAERPLAAELAIGRLGEAELVARSIRMERGRLRGSDPVIMPRRVLTACELLLLVAAVAYSIAVRLFDAPCSGEFDQLGAATQQCLDRWESVELLPFLPVLPLGLDGLASSTTLGVFLIAIALATLATVLFTLAQPWFSHVRNWGLAIGACSLITGAAVVAHLVEPTGGLAWWGFIAAAGVDLAVLCAVVQLWSEPLDLGRAARRRARRRERPVVVLSYTRYRVRATLILFGLAGVGGVQLVQQVLLAPASGVLIEVARQGGGFLPMGVTQQVLPLAIVASALSSLLMGVAAGRGISAAPTAARGCPARVQPGE